MMNEINSIAAMDKSRTIAGYSNNCLQKIESKFLYCFSDIPLEDIIKYSNWDDQKLLLDHTIYHHLNKIYPIKRNYQILFLKKLIKYLESENYEVHDLIYEELCKLQAIPDENQGEQITFKHYSLPKHNVIFTLEESKSFVANGTTGLCTWQASLALSNWILSNSKEFEGKKILELGSGTGLLGFIALKCCKAEKMILSDGSVDVIKLLRKNLAQNFQESEILIDDENYQLLKYDQQEIGVLHLPWENVRDLKVENVICPDIILAADVVYDHAIFYPLLDTIEYFFSKAEDQHCRMLLASTIRDEKTLQDFYKLLIERNFIYNIKESCSNVDKEFWIDKNDRVEIVEITKNKS